MSVPGPNQTHACFMNSILQLINKLVLIETGSRCNQNQSRDRTTQGLSGAIPPPPSEKKYTSMYINKKNFNPGS